MRCSGAVLGAALALVALLAALYTAAPTICEHIRPQPDDVQHILLFDGVCNLCNGFVNFALAHDTQNRLTFAALQSESGKALLEKLGIPQYATDLSTVVLVEGDKYYTHSTAVLRTLALLEPPYCLLYGAGIWVPQFVRDWCYSVIGSSRYTLFGKQDTCRVPDPLTQPRFLP